MALQCRIWRTVSHSFKSDLQNFYKYRENKLHPMGTMFLMHHDDLNNLGLK